MEPLAGDDPAEVAGYRVRARLGAGGMGRVYLAFTAGGRPVALKVIRPELGDDQDFRVRFRQEVTAARRVHGLYTAQVLDADTEASPPWLVTAYVPGPSLQQAVTAHGPLPADTVLLMVAGVAEALQAIHSAGLVHRDLKPSNVLLAADGPRVIDFGIARAAEATTVTRTGMRVGSPGFMAPEQAEGLPISPAADVFALGSVAAYTALGRAPFGAGNDAALLYRIVHRAPDLDGCPPSLRGLIERCLAKAATERPSPGEIISECRARTAGQTLQIAQAWLPAAVYADLASHAPPGAVPAAPPPHSTVTVGTAWHDQGGTPPAPEVPPGGARQPGRGRGMRGGLIAGAAALIVAGGIGGGLFAAFGTGGNHGSSGPGDPGQGGSGHGAAAGSRPTTAVQRPKSGGARPAPPANSAACAAGTWKAINQQFTATINGQQVVFTGSGAKTTLRPDGTGESVYKGIVFRASVNGVEWTQTFRGSSRGHWAVRNGDILFSALSSTGTIVLRDDGLYNNSGPLEALPGAVPFTCSGNRMREYFPNGSAELVRQS
jgi:hypothetical protein